MSDDKLNAMITVFPYGVHVNVEPGGQFNCAIFPSTEVIDIDQMMVEAMNDNAAMLIGKAIIFAMAHNADLYHVKYAKQPLMCEDVAKMLPVVADSWPKLRASDCYRLIDCFDLDLHGRIGKVIEYHRPDLHDAVREALADLEAESLG